MTHQYTGTPANDVRWHCENGTWSVPTSSNGLLDIVMVDTNPFIPRYKKDPWYNNAGKGATSMCEQYSQRCNRMDTIDSMCPWTLLRVAGESLSSQPPSTSITLPLRRAAVEAVAATHLHALLIVLPLECWIPC